MTYNYLYLKDTETTHLNKYTLGITNTERNVTGTRYAQRVNKYVECNERFEFNAAVLLKTRVLWQLTLYQAKHIYQLF